MSYIDTNQIFVGGLPHIEFTFNLDGQAFTLDGIPVTGVTFGFNPQYPFESGNGAMDTANDTPSNPPQLPVVPSPVVEVVIVPPPILEVPRGMDSPEPSGMVLMLGGITLILASRYLLTRIKRGINI